MMGLEILKEKSGENFETAEWAEKKNFMLNLQKMKLPI